MQAKSLLYSVIGFKTAWAYREGYDETTDSYQRVPNGGCRPRGLDRG